MEWPLARLIFAGACEPYADYDPHAFKQLALRDSPAPVFPGGDGIVRPLKRDGHVISLEGRIKTAIPSSETARRY
jgi:hypothetical protein